MNESFNIVITDLRNAIAAQCLGSVEEVVIKGALKELIFNWNDHNKDNPIDEGEEYINWILKN